MPSKNRIRGTKVETETVDIAFKYNLKAQRAWGSNGKAMGRRESVDVVVEPNLEIQCKRYKEFPKGFANILPDTHQTHAVVFRQDGRPLQHYICLELDEFLRYYSYWKKHNWDNSP